MRVGQGFDVHPLVPGRRLILAGVEIDHPFGLAGHSDADVLAHAVGDALLGAAGLGDLGGHFPDSEERWRGADSLALLAEIGRLLTGAGYAIVNIDATLIAEEPKIAPHVPRMKARLAGAMGLGHDQVSIKATTTEGLGFVGRAEGMAALAVALIDETRDFQGT